MKIAIISGRDPHYIPDIDGSSVALTNMARSYAALGHTVDIFTPLGYSGHWHLPQKENSQLQFSRNFSPGVSIIRFPVQNVAQGKDEMKFEQRLEVSRGESLYFDDGRLRAYDVIHIYHVMHAFGLVQNGFTPLDRTVLLSMHPGVLHAKHSPVSSQYIESETELFRAMRHIHTFSRAEHSIITGIYQIAPEKVFVVPLGYDDSIFSPIYRENINNQTGINILSVNRIAERKGQKHFVSIAKEAAKRDINFRVHLVGVSPGNHNNEANQCVSEFLKSIETENLSRYFVFYDMMMHEDVSGIMGQCDIAIYPSVTETFGLSALESMVSGLPTIVFDDVPAFMDFIANRETGLIVPRTAGSVADQLEELLDQPALYSHISRGGIKAAHKFTWNSVMTQMMDTFRERRIIN